MITNNGFNLLNKFFAYDPKRRITGEEALKQEYFEVTLIGRDFPINFLITRSLLFLLTLACSLHGQQRVRW